MRKRLVRRRERGAAAVEFALVLPILVVILLGMVDFGLAMNAQAVTANAAREGARSGSLGGTQAEITAAARSATASLVNTSSSNPTITVTCRRANNAACSSSFDTQRESGGAVAVKVSYVYTWISPAILGLPGTTTIDKISEMRIE